jgi:hypothetical protein
MWKCTLAVVLIVDVLATSRFSGACEKLIDTSIPHAVTAFRSGTQSGCPQERNGWPLSRRAYLDNLTLDTPATRLIGIRVENGRSWLDGETVDGIAITNVAPHSPAASASLKGAGVAHRVKPFDIMRPDLIIAADAVRVRDLADFQESVQDLLPGEIVYLTIVRDDRRYQVRVLLPGGLPAAQPSTTQ